MKKQMYCTSPITMLLILCAMLCLLNGCSDNEMPQPVIDDFAGQYEIISITSGQALDLNNDGIASNDLYSEYTAEFHWENAVYLPEPYHFTDPYNFAEFKRNESLEVNCADLKFPCQSFNERDWAGPEIPLLRGYNWGLINMSYQIEDDSQVEIIPYANSSNSMGYISSLKRWTKDVFQVEMTLHIYDFKQQKWIITPIWAVYERRISYSDTELMSRRQFRLPEKEINAPLSNSAKT